MVQSFNDNVNPRRVLGLQGWTRVIIRPSAPVRISTNQQEALNAVSGLADGLLINQPVNNADIFQVWWKGEMWMIAVNSNTQCIILTPGAVPISIGGTSR